MPGGGAAALGSEGGAPRGLGSGGGGLEGLARLEPPGLDGAVGAGLHAHPRRHLPLCQALPGPELLQGLPVGLHTPAPFFASCRATIALRASMTFSHCPGVSHSSRSTPVMRLTNPFTRRESLFHPRMPVRA